MGSKEIKQKILDYLAAVPDKWEYSSQIAVAVGNNRVTVSRYLDVLHAEKQVQMKEIGKAKMWSLPTPSKPLVLIVDDEPNIVQLIKFSLDSNYYSTIEAFNGEQGLEKAMQYTPDIIILDIMMPRMDGYEVCRQLKSHPHTQNIPVVFLSAKQQPEDRAKVFATGAEQFIQKPFDPLELEARVSSIMKRKESAQQRNSVTGLPTEQSLKSWQAVSENKTVPELKVKLDNLDIYSEIFGYRKLNELIQFVAKLLLHDVQAQNKDVPMFVAHVPSEKDTIFVICAQKFSISGFSKILEETLPFLYGVESFTKNKFLHQKKEYPIIQLTQQT